MYVVLVKSFLRLIQSFLFRPQRTVLRVRGVVARRM